MGRGNGFQTGCEELALNTPETFVSEGTAAAEVSDWDFVCGEDDLVRVAVVEVAFLGTPEVEPVDLIINCAEGRVKEAPTGCDWEGFDISQEVSIQGTSPRVMGCAGETEASNLKLEEGV